MSVTAVEEKSHLDAYSAYRGEGALAANRKRERTTARSQNVTVRGSNRSVLTSTSHPSRRHHGANGSPGRNKRPDVPVGRRRHRG
jgi:hypothetical protein